MSKKIRSTLCASRVTYHVETRALNEYIDFERKKKVKQKPLFQSVIIKVDPDSVILLDINCSDLYKAASYMRHDEV